MYDRGEGFSFVNAGRTFTCRVEGSRPRAGDAWWWFDVSTERHERHAPFRAEPADDEAGVRARVVAYYDELLARRAAPAQGRWHQRPRGAAATSAQQAAPAM
jgi:hypothetical protein